MSVVNHVAVLTSGGDAPGMNAATRAAVRSALAHELRISGVTRGFGGLLEGDFTPLDARSVSNIIQRGGTILKTTRTLDFLDPARRAEAARHLSDAGIEGIVGIGGDGTFRGLHALAAEHGVRCIGVPGTIDNDLFGTDYTIGFDTAINTALESIDKIRDTAESHGRIFFIEVMGRASGAIALSVGVSGGAEEILIPEVSVDIEGLCSLLIAGRERGKTSFIIVVAEGAMTGGARAVAEAVSERADIDYRVSILGHVQRGGSPTSFDRELGTLLGAAAVDALVEGETDKMVGVECGHVTLVPLAETWEKHKPVDLELLRVAQVVAT
jgi:6-phosphofructokinase 1